MRVEQRHVSWLEPKDERADSLLASVTQHFDPFFFFLFQKIVNY